MTTPEGFWGGPRADNIESEIRQLRAEVKALRERGVRDAGALTIKNPAGFITLQSGPSSTVQDDVGAPQWVTVLRDVNGAARYALYDPLPLSDGYVQALWMWDHLSRIVMTTDRNGGWAEPWFSIPLYQKFQTPAGVFQYSSTAVNVAEQTLWGGEAGYISHPRISVAGVWGQASGSGQTTRYRLKVNGTTVGTWDVSGLTVDTRGPYDVTAWRNFTQISVDITAQSLAGTGSYACQLIGCHLRQS